MSKKYALLIGNSQYDDTQWIDLKRPGSDVEAMADVLRDPKIGQFDHVETVHNGTLLELRRAIATLFRSSGHKPDDLLLLYFSGHGWLSPENELFFIGRDTEHGDLAEATGLRADFVTGYMNRARSLHQVVLLDSCFSGMFGQSAKGNVPTQEIFGGTGRYIIASSESLQLSWEGDRALGDIENSFFTHFLVQGLRTGDADLNNDGYVDIAELYTYVKAEMGQVSTKQVPVWKAPEAKGILHLTQSPIAPWEREREQVADLLVQAENAFAHGDYGRALALCKEIVDAEPDSVYGQAAAQFLLDIEAEQRKVKDYQDVQRLLNRSKRLAQRAWQDFSHRYPDYDPDNIGRHFVVKRTALDILPDPFAWIEIPNKGYSIGKYLVTNGQFKLFVDAGGYRERKWWTVAGWEARQKGWDWNSGKREWEPTNWPWTGPRYWLGSKWNRDLQPVVGVSWFEAVAFCLWLSEESGQAIMLPTEDQWQYAAQGEDGREYPWGNKWDGTRCQNSVKPQKSDRTSDVTFYEGKGDSPFGVVDMAGNVWEWCLTDYDAKTNEVNSDVKYRVLLGGSLLNDMTDKFRISFRGWGLLYDRHYDMGFRLALSA